MSSWLRGRSLRGRSVSGGAIYLQDNKTCCKTVACREGELVQDIIKDACRQLDIPPMARVFFALCVREKGIPFHPLSPYSRLSRQESKKQYQLRVFVNVENSNYLLHVSAAAHDYYYRQLRNDFIEDHLQPRATINSAVWMAAIDMAREAKLRNKKFEDLQGEIHKFMPDFLHKRYKKDSKVEEKIKETFDRFHELNNVDNSHYINKFLEVYEKDKMCGRHLFPLKQSGVLSPIRGGPQQLVVISLKEGVYKTVVGDPDDKKEPICSIADITALRADFSLSQLTISKSQDSSDSSSDTTLYFVDQKHLVAFSVIVQAYWRLKVDGSNIILGGDIAPPEECLKVGKSDRLSLCHGPIAQMSVEQVLMKFNIEEGHFLVRESRTMDDAYTLSVCHNKKVMHYRIVRHEDGSYSFRDPERTEGDSALEQNGQPHEYEKFPTLHDLIKSYHQKADGLPTILRLNIAPNIAGKIPLLPPKHQAGSLTPSSSESMPIDDNRPQSSSSEDHSYIDSTLSPTSSAPQTPNESHPPPPFSQNPAQPENEYILELYRAGVPFVRYKDLKITGKLGQGHFSKVFRAQMKDSNGEERTVAVKIPEVDFDDSTNAELAKKDLTREMLTMHSFDHHNIVKLIRISETPHYLDYIGMLPVMIMEFVQGGSLRGYLDKKRANITADLMSRSKTIFLDIGQQIAEGMKYLEERKVVHRDLAARNVLMVDESHVKISDFGLSRRKIEDKEYYKTKLDQPAGLPIFWYAPECLLSLKFTTQGDVWSYGTTLWEIFTFGGNPSTHLHPVVTNRTANPYKFLAEYYRQGNRLPRGNCNTTILQILYRCWSYDPSVRPTFDSLATQFRDLLQSIQRQERQSAPQKLQQDSGYVPMERTIPPTGNSAATFPRNGVAVISSVAS